jgi:mono/diheme cytochrome c family protein/Cu/Ag efflux protein CusF
MKTTLLPFPSLLIALGLLAGCGKPAAPEAPKTATPAPAKAEAPADVPKLTGVIQDVLPERSSLVIKHEEIPGVMRAMTMAFRVDAATLQAAQKGQAITGDFSSSGMNFTLSNVKLGPAPTPGSTPPATQAATTTAQPAPAPAMSMPMNMPMGQGMPMMPGMDMPMPAAAPAPAAPVTTAPQTPSPAQLATGAAVYTRVCIACHQPTGVGLFPLFPPLAGSSIVTGDTRRLARILLSGLQGPIDVNGRTFNGVMPGLASQYNDDELAAVLTYVRNTWGNTAAPVPASVLAAERAANRTTPWTWAELTGP